METQREMGRDVLRGFVRVASEEERCGSDVSLQERTLKEGWAEMF